MSNNVASETRIQDRWRSIKETLSCMTAEDDDEIMNENIRINMQRRKSAAIDRQIKLDKKEYICTYRLLLLGAGESGKSTVLKQMKILHKNGFSEEERVKMAVYIKENIRDAIVAISEALTTLSPPIILENPENETSIAWLMKNSLKLDFTYPPEFYVHTQNLWKDKGIQEAYERSNEYQLIDCAKYFLDKLDEIKAPGYIPSILDILWCRVLTTTIIEMQFRIRNICFQIFDVGGQRSERRKWIQCFNDVTAIIFVCSSSSFDMVLREDLSQNRLEESFRLFPQLWNNRWLCTRSFIIFINKCDLLSEKIRSGRRKFEDYFPDVLQINLAKYSSDKEPPEVVRALVYIHNRFDEISKPTERVNFNGMERRRYLYQHFTCAVDSNNFKRVFKDCQDMIKRIHLRDYGLM